MRIDAAKEKLAIHGGDPVRSKSFPSWPQFGQAEEEQLLASLRSGAWGKVQGTEVSRFEKRFAEYHQCKHGIGVVNGTVAIRVALMALGIEPGDEVIVPPFTFVATASAVIEANATPIFVDIELETSNIDPKAIEAAITPRTKAIIVVHLGGLACKMDTIMDLAKRHGLAVIEDACHAHGAEYKGRRLGSIGDLAAFSFQSSKNVSAGEGGIIITNNGELAQRCWSIHNCGRVPDGKWYEHHCLGGNYRLGEFQGAVLNAQWDRFEDQAQTRERNGRYLDEQLAGLDGITPQVRTADCTRHAYHLYSLLVDPDILGISRETFLEAMAAEGVPLMAAYPIPLYHEPLFTNRAFGPFSKAANMDYGNISCPQCEILSTRQGVWIEQRYLLGTREDMDDIVCAIKKVHGNRDQLSTG
ncbi:MAG: DegT/DnrJ/EryC1/StrS family aminotransferase [Pirellulales bacterium]|nr:DegT/DnrJ/EryC1/StrS family aminotransferase [Pirellulales bacterium]